MLRPSNQKILLAMFFQHPSNCVHDHREWLTTLFLRWCHNTRASVYWCQKHHYSIHVCRCLIYACASIYSSPELKVYIPYSPCKRCIHLHKSNKHIDMPSSSVKCTQMRCLDRKSLLFNPWNNLFLPDIASMRASGTGTVAKPLISLSPASRQPEILIGTSLTSHIKILRTIPAKYVVPRYLSNTPNFTNQQSCHVHAGTRPGGLEIGITTEVVKAELWLEYGTITCH